MAVDFLFENPTKQIPTIKSLREKWENIPSESIRDTICYEHQYLEFHVWLLRNIRYTRVGHIANPPYKNEISHSVRAGSVKAAVLLCASIAEASLRAHAEKRNYKLPKNPTMRTFGCVLKTWKIGGVPHADIAIIWQELEELRLHRNNVHLHVAANNPNAYFEEVLAKEEAIFSNAKKVLKHLRTIKSA